MKVEIILKCIGLYFIYFIAFIISGLFFHGFILKYVTVLLMGVTAYIIWKKNKIKLIRPLNNKISIIVIPFFVGVGVSFINLIQVIPSLLRGEEFYASFDNYFIFIIFVIVASIVEEVFFRGIFLNMCKPYFSMPATILIPAILFSFNHLVPSMMLHTFIGGLIFGYFYYYSENIVVPVIIHLTTNLLWSTMLTGYLVEALGISIGIIPATILFILLGIIIIISMIFIYRKRVLEEN